MQRYVANKNRVMGGLLITTQRHQPRACGTKFAHAGAACVADELRVDRFGLDAVRPPVVGFSEGVFGVTTLTT